MRSIKKSRETEGSGGSGEIHLKRFLLESAGMGVLTSRPSAQNAEEWANPLLRVI